MIPAIPSCSHHTAMSASSAPPPPYQPPNQPPRQQSGVQFACNAACVFYSFLAVLAHDQISRDGQKEALALADCMLACE
jgi:hypothetical protein